MDEEERTEKLKDQFLEGLFDRNVKRETLMSLNIKSCITSAQPVSFEELVQYAVAYEKSRIEKDAPRELNYITTPSSSISKGSQNHFDKTIGEAFISNQRLENSTVSNFNQNNSLQ